MISVPMEWKERFDPRRFFRGEKAVDGPVLLTHRRVFIVPNGRGFGLAVLLAIQFLAAINYGNNLAFILTFLLAGIAMQSTLHAFRNLAGLSVRRGKAPPVFAGEPARFELHLDNPSRIHRLGLTARLAGSATPVRFDVAPGTTATLILHAETEQRGWLSMPTVTFDTSFPLGLFRAWSPINLRQRVLVYPRPAPPGIRPTPIPEPGLGVRPDTREEEDFHGFSAYRPGDPLKRIHWKGVAKGQGVHVKQYAGGDTAELLLDWQYTPGADVEARLSRLCRWVLDAEAAGTPYGLRLPGVAIQKGRGEAHRARCLEALALFGT
ncbi:DUF58 domain-containing protein [Methylococcus capsulatus]|uniref:DUF58 domain-containing protein n=1 Tax=Methylococcus capsulatus TaxID=414 RepID=UPI001C529846|nr:DUF58 domain-containing protein [Methylococcus capsulatus]QXP88717.1 DUF58 domain-containing protein [Methylococcus capsulatus]QXP94251.1 DUF58 domain-containing protein [Methylococcus capsulatus]UQN10996.1 DUF58 domain-containing protein [Methylococcus capsulatus]